MSQSNQTTKIDPALVVSVYVGEPGACCCGCSGVYSYAKAHQERGGKDRGYAVPDEAINDVEVARVVGLLNGADLEDDGPGFFSAEVDGELLIARYAGA